MAVLFGGDYSWGLIIMTWLKQNINAAFIDLCSKLIGFGYNRSPKQTWKKLMMMLKMPRCFKFSWSEQLFWLNYSDNHKKYVWVKVFFVSLQRPLDRRGAEFGGWLGFDSSRFLTSWASHRFCRSEKDFFVFARKSTNFHKNQYF